MDKSKNSGSIIVHALSLIITWSVITLILYLNDGFLSFKRINSIPEGIFTLFPIYLFSSFFSVSVLIKIQELRYGHASKQEFFFSVLIAWIILSSFLFYFDFFKNIVSENTLGACIIILSLIYFVFGFLIGRVLRNLTSLWYGILYNIHVIWLLAFYMGFPIWIIGNHDKFGITKRWKVASLIIISITLGFFFFKIQKKVIAILHFLRAVIFKKKYILLLRSFNDIRSTNAPDGWAYVGGDESFSWRKGKSVVTNITRALQKFFPIVSLGLYDFRNSTDLAHAIQLKTTDENWFDDFKLLAKNAESIVIITALSNSLMEELDYIITGNLKYKLIIISPPIMETDFDDNKPELYNSYRDIKSILECHNYSVPKFNENGQLLQFKKHKNQLKSYPLFSENLFILHIKIRKQYKLLISKSDYNDNNLNFKEVYHSLKLRRK
jgi:hypothetical protein